MAMPLPGATFWFATTSGIVKSAPRQPTTPVLTLSRWIVRPTGSGRRVSTVKLTVPTAARIEKASRRGVERDARIGANRGRAGARAVRRKVACRPRGDDRRADHGEEEPGPLVESLHCALLLVAGRRPDAGPFRETARPVARSDDTGLHRPGRRAAEPGRRFSCFLPRNARPRHANRRVVSDDPVRLKVQIMPPAGQAHRPDDDSRVRVAEAEAKRRSGREYLLPVDVVAIGAALGLALVPGISARQTQRRRSSPPHGAVAVALGYSFVLDFLGALLGGTAVELTIAGLVSVPNDEDAAVYASGGIATIGFVGVAARLGLPTGATHGMIGGLTGAGLAAGGVHAINWGGFDGSDRSVSSERSLRSCSRRSSAWPPAGRPGASRCARSRRHPAHARAGAGRVWSRPARSRSPTGRRRPEGDGRRRDDAARDGRH